MKKLLIISLLIFGMASAIVSMEMPPAPPNQGMPQQVYRPNSNSPAKKAKADPQALSIDGNTIRQEIYNLDLQAINALLALDSVKSLSTDEKSRLYELASQYANQINQFALQGVQLTANSTDPGTKKRFSHQEDLNTITKISRTLNVLLNLKNLRFPQVLFSAQPYLKGPRISLDHALEAFIMAEQEQIRSCCFHLTLYNIAQALVAKKNEGINIELVTDQTQGNNPSLHALKHLVSNGISVYSPKNNGFETSHHKFFMFKNNVLNKQLVWMGSYNPTGHSNENSWDDVVILDDSEIFENYLGRFAQIKSVSQPVMQELLQKNSNPSEWVLRYNNVPKELWN